MAFRPIHETQQALGTLQEEMNRLFERVWHGGLSTPPFDGQAWAPPIDFYEFDDRFVLQAEVPGVAGEGVEVTHAGGSLTFRGEKARPEEVSRATGSVYNERRFGTFCRTVDLPTGVDAAGISARCHGGVLEITIPKSEKARPKSVRVTTDE